MNLENSNVVAFTGAGISAESGLKTFRDNGGLWEEYNVYEVATPEAFASNPKLVLDFYNLRRKQLKDVFPNNAHKAIASLEAKYNVTVITQNVDDLHERSGSSKVIHLHGELTKARCTTDERDIVDIGYEELHLGDLSSKGFQLRPHIVWFGEGVPMMDRAIEITQKADVFITVGTSLNVYPAAGLVHETPVHCKKYLIDPHALEMSGISNMEIINEKAGTGMSRLSDKLLNNTI